MKPALTSFFQTYPIEGDLAIALKMVMKKLHQAEEAVEGGCEEHEYMVHLSDAERMIQAIYTELGLHPDQYRS